MSVQPCSRRRWPPPICAQQFAMIFWIAAFLPGPDSGQTLELGDGGGALWPPYGGLGGGGLNGSKFRFEPPLPPPPFLQVPLQCHGLDMPSPTSSSFMSSTHRQPDLQVLTFLPNGSLQTEPCEPSSAWYPPLSLEP